MLVRTLRCLVASATFAGALSAQSADSIHYSVAPVLQDSALTALAVEIRLAGDGDGETRLQLPGEWAGSDSLWRHLSGVRVDGAASVREDGPDARVIAHAPGAPLVVRYRVASAYTADPGRAFEKARPIVLPGWFFFHGEGVFATPEGRDESPVSFAWRSVPAGWTVASDLDHLGGTRPGTVTDISESAAIGAPDLVVVERRVGGAPLRLATLDRWSFPPARLADAVAAIVDAENRFWGEPGRPFIVPVAPLGGPADGYSFSGTGRSDGFSIAGTPGFTLDLAAHFLAHEYMHTWNAAELGGYRGENEGLIYWFSEGFTDFYAGRILLRAGLWTPAEYVEKLNAVTLRYASSPAYAATNAQLAERFWSDRAYEKMPYDRGHLLALLLDARIRRETGGRAGMDDVMRAQLAAARGEAGRDERMDVTSLFASVARDRFGVDLADDLARYADRGEPVLLPADLFAPCATVRTVTQPQFDRGFDVGATDAAGGVVVGVDSASPAFAAGLRDGMRILRREAGTPGDAAVEYAYRVDDGGTERVIRYLPAGKDTLTFQRVVLGPDAASPECARWMSGG